MTKRRIAGMILAAAVALTACGGGSGPDPVPAQPFDREPAAPTGVISGVRDVAADLESRNDAAQTP